MVGSAVLLGGAPAHAVVVLRAGADEPGQGLPVDEDHVVPLAVPVHLLCLPEVVDVDVAAHVVALPLGLEEEVVPGAVGVLPLELPRPVLHPLVGDAVGGVLPVPCRVEPSQAGLQFIVLLVVDVVVEGAAILLPLVLDGDLGALFVGHGPPAVEALPVLGAHLEGGGDIVVGDPVADAEEVADGNLDAGVLLPVPVCPEHQLPEVPLVAAPDGDPDVLDAAGSLHLGEDRRLPGGDHGEVLVPAGPVVAGDPPPLDVPDPGKS